MCSGQAHQRGGLVEAVTGAIAAVYRALRFCFEPLHHVQQVAAVTAALAPSERQLETKQRP
jgi:hypothetical protein